MALESTQPLTEMVGKGGRGVGMKTMPPSCANCLEIQGVSMSWSPKGLLQRLFELSQALYNIRDRKRCRLKNISLSLSLFLCHTHTYTHFYYLEDI
jgi:hypothetical protein